MHRGQHFPQSRFRAFALDCAIGFFPPTYCKLDGLVDTALGVIHPALADWATLDFDSSLAKWSAAGSWTEAAINYTWSFTMVANGSSPGMMMVARVEDFLGHFAEHSLQTLGDGWQVTPGGGWFTGTDVFSSSPTWPGWAITHLVPRLYSDF